MIAFNNIEKAKINNFFIFNNTFIASEIL